MRFHTAEQLGPRQAVLPSGTLWCRDVTIARTGVQHYHRLELPGIDADADSNGMIRVQRDEDEVFDERAIASFEGVPITMEHPDSAVEPANWRDLAVGHVQNVRRDGDTLIADLLVHDRRAIEAIRNRGWRGVSCGYDANYQPAGRGKLRQTDITGNHVALLPPSEEPRCGDACMIGDSAPNRRTTMKRTTIRDQAGAQYRAGLRNPSHSAMGDNPESPSGAELVQVLEGDATSYYIANDGKGRACLYRTVEADDALDPGTISKAATADMFRASDARSRATMASITKSHREFWAQR
jgi:hypothetical protein